MYYLHYLTKNSNKCPKQFSKRAASSLTGARCCVVSIRYTYTYNESNTCTSLKIALFVRDLGLHAQFWDHVHTPLLN